MGIVWFMEHHQPPDVFAYLDYRACLRDLYQARKASDRFFSYRQMALRTGVDAGWIAKVLSGQEHLSQRSLQPFARLFGMGERESAYFEALVALAKARGVQERAAAFESAMALKSPARRTLGEQQLAYYGRWWHPAVRCLLALLGNRASSARIAGLLRPRVQEQEVSDSIELLKSLGLVKKSGKGWEAVDAFVSSPPEGAKAAVRAYQAATMDLAKDALESHSPVDRDISTLTLSFDRRDLPLVKERLAAVRDSLIQLSREAEHPEVVYQVNMQIFPLSVPDETKP